MNILLGITGSVSAYKAPWLVRDLRRAGHEVRVVMTPSARQFVAPLALEATSLHPVIIDPYDPKIQEGGSWHVHLAQWADVALIAPCSATTLAKLANGIADSALMTVVMSMPNDRPVIIAPAMDTDMWEHATTQRNIERVANDGVIVIPPDEGPLASGLVGKGRLPELQTIIDAIPRPTSDVQRPTALSTVTPWRNPQPSTLNPLTLNPLTLTITAGPTHEPIDAVRSIVNHSTGTMGFALAEAARDRGMLVTLITGPVALPTPMGVERIDVRTAKEMFEAVQLHVDADVVVMSAAVADFTPAQPAEGKIKKDSVGETMTVELQRTQDILAWLGAHKQQGQTIVGFALEHDNVVGYAEAKLKNKNADMIIANQAGIARSGFGGTDNTITIVTKNEPPAPYPPMSKRACAEVILDHVLMMRKEQA